MPVSGPRNPGTTGEVAAPPATESWSSRNDARIEDGAYAQSFPGSGQQTHWLVLTNFGFTIPAHSTIDGIIVEMKKAGGATDLSVRLWFAGAAVGTNKASANLWIDAYETYGSSSDLWGWTPTRSRVNNSGFGCAIRAQNGTAFIDAVRMTIHYTTGSGGGSVSATALLLCR